MPRVGQREIAEKCGVSQKTVSLALADSPRISRERKEQVRRVAEELGYRPDALVSAAFSRLHGPGSHQTSGTILCAISGAGELVEGGEFTASLLKMLRAEVEHHSLGFDVIYPEREFAGKPERLRTVLQSRGCCGCLTIEAQRPFSGENGNLLSIFLDYPSVGVTRLLRPPLPRVVIYPDEAACVYEGLERAGDAGFQKPALVTESGLPGWGRRDAGAPPPLVVAARGLGLPVVELPPLQGAGDSPVDALRKIDADCLFMNVRERTLQALPEDHPPVMNLNLDLDLNLAAGAAWEHLPGFQVNWRVLAKTAMDALRARLAGSIFHGAGRTTLLVEPEWPAGGK